MDRRILTLSYGSGIYPVLRRDFHAAIANGALYAWALEAPPAKGPRSRKRIKEFMFPNNIC